MDSLVSPPSELWGKVLAFLKFELFVTPSILGILYYVGALAVPVVAVLAVRRLARMPGIAVARVVLGRRQFPLIPWRGRPLVLGVLLFIAMELGWRMIFEFLLAYFQMHEALLQLTG